MVIDFKSVVIFNINKYKEMLEANPNSTIAKAKLEKYQHLLVKLLTGYSFEHVCEDFINFK